MKTARVVCPDDGTLPVQGEQALARSGTVIVLIPVNSGKFTDATTRFPQTGVEAVNVAVLPVRFMNWLEA